MASVEEAVLAAFDLMEAGRIEDAELLLDRILAVVPGQADALYLSGIIRARAGQLDEAEGFLVQALALRPHSTEIRNNLASVLRLRGEDQERRGKAEVAEALFRRALTLDPANDDIKFHRAGVLQELGRLSEAEAVYSEILRRRHGLVGVRLNRIQVRRLLGDCGTIEKDLRYCIALEPACLPALDELAKTVATGALSWQRRALSLCWPDVEADRSVNYAIGLVSAGRAGEAIELYKRVLALSPAEAMAWNNFGMLREKDSLWDGLYLVNRALAIEPSNPELLSNRASTFLSLGEAERALADSRAAALLAPVDRTWGRVGHALALLMNGALAEGWEEFEHRWDSQSVRKSWRRFPQPAWEGGSINGRLLVWGEQGVGDEIMFASCLPQLLAAGIEVVLECDARLAPVFTRSFPAVEVVARSPEPAPCLLACDVAAQVPSGSLPRQFRRQNSDFTATRYPYLQADSGRAASLRQGLAGSGQRLIGVTWFSKNAETGAARSLPLSILTGVLSGDGVRLISLQYGGEQSELEETGIGVEPSVDPWSDIDGLAALIDAMDLVVSIDNSTLHLAGALGKPTLGLIPFASDWRWFRDRVDCPWYPSVRLLRQKVLGDWSPVLAQLREEVGTRLVNLPSLPP